MMTADPAPQVAAILRPLRDLADEIVIAADSRVADDDLAGYATVADRLLRVEYRIMDRHLGWLHRQCKGDWILRLDGDEVVSPALLERLPELLRSRDVDQYRIAQRWVYPDAGHLLAEHPWGGDYLNRLVRNTAALRFGGRLHEQVLPSGPSEFVTEPTYHLDLVLSDEAARRAKVIRYEVAAPHKRSGGRRFNEAYYLPEQRDDLQPRPLPPADRACVEAVMNPPAVPGPLPELNGSAPLVPLADLDAWWEGAPVPPAAHRARIEPHEPPRALTAGEQRRLFFHVTNLGSVRWPWGLDQQPPIRLSYHWLAADGTPEVHDGLRTAFPRAVGPGERILAGLDVMAPDTPGERILEVDVVHEDVCWFGVTCRLPVVIDDPSAIHPPAGERLKPSAPGRAVGASASRQRIPRALHRIWTGDAPLPDEFAAYGESFRAHHPDWEIRLWGDDDLAGLGIGERERAAARSASELSNLIRYEILVRHGGVYVDTDVECRRSFEPLLRGIDAFAALELPGRVGTAVLGSAPGHPAFRRAAAEARRTLGLGAHTADANGPYFLSLLLEQEPDVTILGPEVFYPYLWTEPERRADDFPDAYAVHHWAGSWR